MFVDFLYLFLDNSKIMRYCLLEMEVNNIAIKLEKIHFDKDTIEELNKFAKNYRMKIVYYYGYIVELKKQMYMLLVHIR